MDSRSDRNGEFDPQALTESQLRALLRALANLPDAEPSCCSSTAVFRLLAVGGRRRGTRASAVIGRAPTATYLSGLR